jgi:hypothetical protein
MFATFKGTTLAVALALLGSGRAQTGDLQSQQRTIAPAANPHSMMRTVSSVAALLMLLLAAPRALLLADGSMMVSASSTATVHRRALRQASPPPGIRWCEAGVYSW